MQIFPGEFINLWSVFCTVNQSKTTCHTPGQNGTDIAKLVQTHLILLVFTIENPGDQNNQTYNGFLYGSSAGKGIIISIQTKGIGIRPAFTGNLKNVVLLMKVLVGKTQYIIDTSETRDMRQITSKQLF